MSQFATVQGWTIQAPLVVLTLKPVAQLVQVVPSVQVRQFVMTEQLAHVEVPGSAKNPEGQVQVPLVRVKLLRQPEQAAAVQVPQ